MGGVIEDVKVDLFKANKGPPRLREGLAKLWLRDKGGDQNDFLEASRVLQ